MNTDIRVDVGFLDHWKTETLISECGADSVLSLIRIWIFAAQNKPTGKLDGIKTTMIERVAKWRGEGGKLLNCLTDLRFIEQDADGVWCLHDWAEHNPYAAHAEWRKDRAKKANSARWRNRSAYSEDGKEMLQGYYKDASSIQEESSGNPPAPAPTPAPTPLVKNISKKKYGEFQNVLLTDEEMEKLKGRFDGTLDGKIENLSAYIASKGEKYKSHYATLIAWDKKDKDKTAKNSVNESSGPIFADGIQRKIL